MRFNIQVEGKIHIPIFYHTAITELKVQLLLQTYSINFRDFSIPKDSLPSFALICPNIPVINTEFTK